MADQVSPVEIGTLYDWGADVVAIPAGVQTLLAPADARRVWISMGVQGAFAPVIVWPGGPRSDNLGLALSGINTAEFWFARHGPICGLPWYAFSGGGGNVYLLTLSLRAG